MADSSTTKKALASSLKELLSEHPYKKISISDICQKCNINRKSFYYHFKDKYDLVNWIFDSEFSSLKKSSDEMHVISLLCRYLYVNRDFYKRAFKIEGQNSLHSHFLSLCAQYVSEKLQLPPRDIAVYFYSNALVCAVERWIFEQDCISPDDFYARLCLINERLFS